MERRDRIVSRRSNGTIRVQTHDTEPSMTDQSFEKDCDVNEIVRKFSKTGQISHLRKSPGVFADLTAVSDLLNAFEVVATAKTMFAEMPAEVRRKFHNDPLILESWLSDPKNTEEAIDLGLLTPTRPPSPTNSAGNPPDETPIPQSSSSSSGSSQSKKSKKSDE